MNPLPNQILTACSGQPCSDRKDGTPMSGMICIRYRTPEGVLGEWKVRPADVKDASAAGCEAYLKYWHPNYTFLGVDSPYHVAVDYHRETDTDGDR